MTQLEYLNTEIAKADKALTAVPKGANVSPAFARLRELKIARKVMMEMEAKKIYP